MKKVFISQPMGNKTIDEITEVRQNAIEHVEKLFNDEVKVLDSFMLDDIKGKDPLWLLGKSIQIMAEADVVYFAKGWQEARGCRIEHECALSYEVATVIEE